MGATKTAWCYQGSTPFSRRQEKYYPAAEVAPSAAGTGAPSPPANEQPLPLDGEGLASRADDAPLYSLRLCGLRCGSRSFFRFLPGFSTGVGGSARTRRYWRRSMTQRIHTPAAATAARMGTRPL